MTEWIEIFGWLIVVLVASLALLTLLRRWSTRATPPPSKIHKENERKPLSPDKQLAEPVPQLLTLERDGHVWRVLVVDDLPVWANAITNFASLLQCEVRVANDLQAAVCELARWEPHLILLDLHMPRDNWQPLPDLYKKYGPQQKTLAFCEQVTSHPQFKRLVVAVTSVEEQAQHQEAAAKAGAQFFYTKANFTLAHFEDLLARVRAVQMDSYSPSRLPT